MSNRIVIVGGPGTGKTTLASDLAAKLDITARHTDDVKHLGWSESSAEVAKWFDMSGDWVVEGVATARALRKWLSVNLGEFDAKVIVLRRPRGRQTNGQTAMARGVETVWREIRETLEKRGAVIEERELLVPVVARPVKSVPVVQSSILAEQETCSPIAH